MSTTREEVQRVWRGADCVCFDVDSTVVVDEGIDELACFLSKGAAVAELTMHAMQGGMSYRAALRARLDIIQPTHGDVTRFVAQNPPRLTPGIERLVTVLQQRDVPVYLISGGFQMIVESVADRLKIPRERVFANTLLFDGDGAYAGFDEARPTSDDNGKARLIAELKDVHGYSCVVHVGDGVTDLGACPPADAFIGFGGNQVRDEVRNKAAWFVTDFDELTNQL